MIPKVCLTAEPTHVSVRPGEQRHLELTIKNVDCVPAIYHLSVTGLPYEWYELSATHLSVAPGASEHIHLSVEPFVDSMYGHYPFRVQITSDDDASIRASTIVALIVVGEPDTGSVLPSDAIDPPTDPVQRDLSDAVLNGASVSLPERSAPLPVSSALPIAVLALLLVFVAIRVMHIGGVVPSAPAASVPATPPGQAKSTGVSQTPLLTTIPVTPSGTGHGNTSRGRGGHAPPAQSGARATPSLRLGATTLSFGSQAIHTIGVTRYLQITNLGPTRATNWHATLIGSASGDYTLGGNCANQPIDTGAACSITIVFAPRGKGLRSAILSVADNDPRSSQSVLLTGRGIAGKPTSVPGHGSAVAALPRWVNISPPQVSTKPNTPPNNYGFQAIALDPAHTRTLYIGTCNQGLWKTINGGGTWFKVNTGTNGAKLDGRLWSVAIDRFMPRTLYVANGYGSEGGVWKSTDGGVNWEQMLPPTSPIAQHTNIDVSAIVTDPYKSGHVLVAFHGPWGSSAKAQDSGVLESLDGGQTWRIHEPRRGWGWGNYVSFLGTSSTWLMGTQGAGFWRTTDSGHTWTKVTATAVSDGAAAVYRARNGVWYATAFGSILRSANGGATWQSVGPSGGYYYAIIGDGANLFAQQYTSGPVTFYDSPESDGVHWSPYNTQTFATGSRSLAYDPVHHIVYSSNGLAGVWKLQVTRKATSP